MQASWKSIVTRLEQRNGCNLLNARHVIGSSNVSTFNARVLVSRWKTFSRKLDEPVPPTDKPTVLPCSHIYPQNAGLAFWDHKEGLLTAHQWHSWVVGTLEPSPRVHPTLTSGLSTMKVLGGDMTNKTPLNILYRIYMQRVSGIQMWFITPNF